MKCMTALTKTAVTARKVIRYSLYFIVFLTVGRILLGVGVSIYKTIFPPAPPPPTVKFGKLPAISFPEKNKVNINYSLETATGDLPKLPDQAKVYYVLKDTANLLALDAAKEKARSLGFGSEPNKLSDNTYSFKNPNVPATLEMNIVSGSFSVSYDLNSDRGPITNKPPAAEVAAAAVRAFLGAADILPEDLTGGMVPKFLKLDNGKFITALSQSDSDAVKINLFRKDYDELPAKTTDPTEANVWFMVSGSQDRNQQIIAGEYHYFKVDESQFSTYPIKTPKEAFGELQSGNAFIADQGTVQDGENLKIRKVYLAYFDSENPSDFYQPIYVFEGDKNFVAYLPAVTSDYYGE